MNRFILLVEDDLDDQELFKAAFNHTGSEIVLKMVEDGQKAAEYLSRCSLANLPCAVLIDYNMPVMDGRKLLEWMDGRSWLQAIRKFVWSTSDEKVFKDYCLQQGASGYFVKPYTVKGVADIVMKIINSCG